MATPTKEQLVAHYSKTMSPEEAEKMADLYLASKSGSPATPVRGTAEAKVSKPAAKPATPPSRPATAPTRAAPTPVSLATAIAADQQRRAEGDRVAAIQRTAEDNANRSREFAHQVQVGNVAGHAQRQQAIRDMVAGKQTAKTPAPEHYLVTPGYPVPQGLPADHYLARGGAAPTTDPRQKYATVAETPAPVATPTRIPSRYETTSSAPVRQRSPAAQRAAELLRQRGATGVDEADDEDLILAASVN